MFYAWKAILLGAALAIASPLGAQVHKRTPVEIFRDATQYQLMGCQMAVMTVFRDVQAGIETRPLTRISSCIRNGKSQTERLFLTASKHVMGKPDAERLLAEYYGVWLTVFENVMPNSTVSRVDYQLRQGERQRYMNYVWEQLQIALGSSSG